MRDGDRRCQENFATELMGLNITRLEPLPQKEIKELAKGGSITFIGKIVGTGLKYFTQIIIAWLLGATSLGIYSLGMAFYQLLEVVAGIGLQNGVVRFVSVYVGKGDTAKLKGVLLNSITLPFFSGVVIGSFLFISSDFISYEFFKKPDLAYTLKVFAVALPFGASMIAVTFATTGFHITNYLVYTLHIIHPITNLLAIILFCGVIGFDVHGAVAGWLVAVAIGLISSVYFVRKLFPPIFAKDVKPIFERKKLLTFSLPLLSGNFLWVGLLWTDILMIGFFRTASEVGVYRVATQTALLVIIIVTSLDTIFAPKVADFYIKREFPKMKEIFQIATRWSYILTLPIFLVLGIASKNILNIFGNDFIVGWSSLIILGVGQLINAATGGVSSILIMSNHQIAKMVGDLILAVVNVTLNLIFIPKFGIMGAALATGISIGGTNVIRLIQVYYFLGIQPYNCKYLKPTIAGIIAAILGFSIQYLFSAKYFIFSLIITSFTILSVYIIAIILMHIEDSDKIILDGIIR
ncbi:MAG: oligosaccharide flippase family protein [Nitrospirota bacterium]